MLQKLIEEQKKEFDKRYRIECSAHERTSSARCICSELEDLNSENEDIKSFLTTSLTLAYKQGLKEAIELSDQIEGTAQHTELDEWRAFKHFRNTLRDILD